MNVVSGRYKDESTALGEPWLEHDERYRRSEEFVTALRRIWTEGHAELAGDFNSLNLHRHWRDARTRTLHDPARRKIQHIGRYVLNGTRPPRHGLL